MQKTFLFIVLVLICTFFFSTGKAEIIESIEAWVNNDVITSSEIEEMVQSILLEMGTVPQNIEEYEVVRSRVLNNMVDDLLLIQKARAEGITVDPDKLKQLVNKEQEKIIQSYGSEDLFRLALKEQGLSVEMFREELEDRLAKEYLVNAVIQQEVMRKVRITEADLKSFREENPRKAREFDTVTLAQIFFFCPKGTSPEKEQAKLKLAQEVLTKLRLGQPFEELARQYSEHEETRKNGGLFAEPVRKGELFPELDIAFDMKVGEISDIIRSSQGLHIIKVIARNLLEDYLRNLKRGEKLEELLKELRAKASIRIKQREIE